MKQTASGVQCIGIILDGNRRWARERGLPTVEGHRQGAERLRETIKWVRARGIPNLVVYAMSTENLKRTEEEVSYMMKLVLEYAGKVIKKEFAIDQKGARIRIIGDLSRVSTDVADVLNKVEAQNEQKIDFTLWVCFSYGGRAEIATAAEQLRKKDTVITEESLSKNLWSAGMPDPDLVIRTGGEHRISNFLLWEISYSELFFVNPFWPDFSEEVLDGVLKEFSERERRRGK